MLLQGMVTELSEVPSGRRDEMFALMDRHYENMRRSDFDRDLVEKRWVIELVESGSGRLCGFSTQRMQDLSVAGRTVKSLFSGDTIVERQHWGSTALALAWGRLAFAVLDEYHGDELVWILISKGFRTYRFMPVYFHEFFPRLDAPTPAWAANIIRAFGQTAFPDRYDAATGIVRAPAEGCRLRPELGDAAVERINDPHVQFFARANPGHGQGDELVCVAPLTRANFTRTAERLIASLQLPAENKR